MLYPPGAQPPAAPGRSPLEWLAELSRRRAAAAVGGRSAAPLPASLRPFVCVLKVGQLLYIPDGWHHATLNRGGQESILVLC